MEEILTPQQPFKFVDKLILIALFFLGIYIVPFAFYNLFAQMINGLQVPFDMITLVIPAIMVIIMFISFIFLHYEENKKKRQRNYLVYGIIVGVLALLSLVFSIIISVKYHGFEGMKTNLFPIDVLVISLFGIVLSADYIYHHVKLLKSAETTFPVCKLHIVTKVGIILSTLLIMYFSGMVLQAIKLSDPGSYARDGFMVICTLLLFTMPLIGGVLYMIVRTKEPGQARLKLQTIFVSVYAFVSLFLIIYISIHHHIINPYFYAWEMHYLFPVGYCFGIVIGIYVLFALIGIASIVSIVFLVLNLRKAKEELETSPATH